MAALLKLKVKCSTIWGDFKRALEARIKTVRMFDRESVAAEWVKVCVEHVEQE